MTKKESSTHTQVPANGAVLLQPCMGPNPPVHGSRLHPQTLDDLGMLQHAMAEPCQCNLKQ